MIKQFFYSTSRTLGRIFAYVLLGFIIYFILSCVKVKADTNYTASVDINFNTSSTNLNQILWNDPNHTSKIFANQGRGDLNFLLYISSGAVNNLPIVQNINARTDSGYSSCHIESFAENTLVSSSANLYSVNCDLIMGTNGLYSLSINLSTQGITTPTYSLSVYRLTFSNNEEAQYSAYNKYLYDYMTQYLYPILSDMDTDTDYNRQQLSWIYSYLQNYIYNTMEEQKDAIEDTTTAINNSSQQTTTAIEGTTQAVNDLTDAVNDDSPADATIIQNISSLMPSDTPITNLILMPVNVLRATYNGLSGTCQPWTINSGRLLGNHDITFPCINLARRLGRDIGTIGGYSVWELIDFMVCIYLIYQMAMLIINAYTKITSLDDPWEELYVPQHGGFETRSGRYYNEY